MQERAVHDRLLDLGARENGPVRDVGGGILVGSVLDPFGNVLGIIKNPHLKLGWRGATGGAGGEPSARGERINGRGVKMRMFLQEHAAQLAAWSQFALAVIALAGIAALVVIALRWASTEPGRRWLLVVGAGLALWFVVGAGILLVVARGPMAPLVRTARNMHRLVGRPFPDLPFRRVSDGVPMRLADFRGKTILVDLWATWCPPCRAELPTLDRLQNEYAGRGLVVVTLSDEPRERLAPVVESLTTVTVNGVVESFGWLATMSNFRPFCVVIDRNGVLRDYAFGVTDYEVFERKVRAYLVR